MDTNRDGSIAHRRMPRDNPTDVTTIVDMALFKFIGLTYALGMYRANRRTAGQRYTMTALLALACLIVLMLVWLVYSMSVNIILVAHSISIMLSVLMFLYKGYVIVMNGERLHNLLDVAYFWFTSCGIQHTDNMVRCRNTLSLILRMCTAFSYFIFFVWCLNPKMVKLMLTYNTMDNDINWIYMFVIITIFFIICCSVYMVFDFYMITICFAICAQFQNVSIELETLGHRQNAPSTSLDITQNIDDEIKLNHYKNLIRLIRDYQRITKIYDDVLKIVWSVISLQIICGSMTLVLFIYISIFIYIRSGTIFSPPVLVFFNAFIWCSIGLYIYCYIFNYVETSKSDLNFSLYCSNWTEMDLKFKKTILLAMSMNSVYNNPMRLSPTAIVNLEMFGKTMKMNYSILSVLLKLSMEKTN